MAQNIVEKLREEAMRRLFGMNSFSEVWDTWRKLIRQKADVPTEQQIVNLGDSLSEIFSSTKKKRGRKDHSKKDGKQRECSVSGNVWEALVCWYLNICNVGRRAVCIKYNKSLVPEPIQDAITVKYGNLMSNSESDLIVIVFPNKQEYNVDKNEINVEVDRKKVELNDHGKYNLKGVLNALVARDFSEIEVHIIQCKTNWNDNAQIPMLWDMIYSSISFADVGRIKIGSATRSIRDLHRFTYSFATVPTVDVRKIKPTSVCVSRVSGLSGGNFWGRPGTNVAKSIKEMLVDNLSGGANESYQITLGKCIAEINESGVYSYFRF